MFQSGRKFTNGVNETNQTILDYVQYSFLTINLIIML